MASIPNETRIRFSSVNETKSAIVPIATKSKNSTGGSSNNAEATLNATPTPAKSEMDSAPLDDEGEQSHKRLVNSQVVRDDL